MDSTVSQYRNAAEIHRRYPDGRASDDAGPPDAQQGPTVALRDASSNVSQSHRSTQDHIQDPNRAARASQPVTRTQEASPERAARRSSLAAPASTPGNSLSTERRLRKALSAICKKDDKQYLALAACLDNIARNELSRHQPLLDELLIASTRRGKPEWVCNCLQWGANADAVAATPRQFGHTALMLATAAGDVGLMKVLMIHGASAAKLDEASGRWHPLLIAAYSLKFDALELLVDSGEVSVDHPNAMGWTALKMALEAKGRHALNREHAIERAKIIRFLVQQKADPLVECQHDEGYADMLAHHQNPLLRHEAEYSDVEGEMVFPSNSATPLEMAARNDDSALEAILLGNPAWAPETSATPFFGMLHYFFNTREGAKARYLAFRENYLKDTRNGRKLNTAYGSMNINV